MTQGIPARIHFFSWGAITVECLDLIAVSGNGNRNENRGAVPSAAATYATSCSTASVLVTCAELKPTARIDWHCATCGSDITPPRASKKGKVWGQKLCCIASFGTCNPAACCPWGLKTKNRQKIKRNVHIWTPPLRASHHGALGGNRTHTNIK